MLHNAENQVDLNFLYADINVFGCVPSAPKSEVEVIALSEVMDTKSEIKHYLCFNTRPTVEEQNHEHLPLSWNMV